MRALVTGVAILWRHRGAGRHRIIFARRCGCASKKAATPTLIVDASGRAPEARRDRAPSVAAVDSALALVSEQTPRASWGSSISDGPTRIDR
jgi:hypothetical protein